MSKKPKRKNNLSARKAARLVSEAFLNTAGPPTGPLEESPLPDETRRLMSAMYTEPIYVDEDTLAAVQRLPRSASADLKWIGRVVGDVRKRLGVAPPG